MYSWEVQVIFLSQAPRSLISPPETPVWLGGNFCSAVLTRFGKGVRAGLFAQLIFRTEAIRKKLPMNCCFISLVMEIAHWCYAESLSLLREAELPS